MINYINTLAAGWLRQVLRDEERGQQSSRGLQSRPKVASRQAKSA